MLQNYIKGTPSNRPKPYLMDGRGQYQFRPSGSVALPVVANSVSTADPSLMGGPISLPEERCYFNDEDGWSTLSSLI